MPHEIFLGQLVSFLLIAIPSILALVFGIEEVGKRCFGYNDGRSAPAPERDEPGEWSGIFEDPEASQSRRLHGLPPRSSRHPK